MLSNRLQTIAKVLRCKIWLHRDGRKPVYCGAYHPSQLGRVVCQHWPKDGDRFEIQIISLEGRRD
jgi:hypothetical protein